MELELGLALAFPIYNPDKGFDLNNHGAVERKEKVMVLETRSYACSLETKNQQVRNKRSFDVAFENMSASAAGNESKMLNLLLWNGQPNEEDDGNGQKRRGSCTSITKNDVGGNHEVGWPPIKSWRKKMLYDQHHDHDHRHLQINQRILADKENENDGIISANSMYVKVKMEGVGIVRKIDIKLHHSYQTLKDSLITMFSSCKGKGKRCENDQEGGGASDNYTLTYQDKQGDWLLAADVPWQIFIESVQRLQILRNGG